jgi:hypothetical protein
MTTHKAPKVVDADRDLHVERVRRADLVEPLDPDIYFAKRRERGDLVAVMVGECERCEMVCAVAPLQLRDPLRWFAVAGAGMLEDVVAEHPSSRKGGLRRPIWACSDSCERVLLKRYGLDPSTAGLR